MSKPAPSSLEAIRDELLASLQDRVQTLTREIQEREVERDAKLQQIQKEKTASNCQEACLRLLADERKQEPHADVDSDDQLAVLAFLHQIQARKRIHSSFQADNVRFVVQEANFLKRRKLSLPLDDQAYAEWRQLDSDGVATTFPKHMEWFVDKYHSKFACPVEVNMEEPKLSRFCGQIPADGLGSEELKVVVRDALAQYTKLCSEGAAFLFDVELDWMDSQGKVIKTCQTPQFNGGEEPVAVEQAIRSLLC